jgi:hypothetical protein
MKIAVRIGIGLFVGTSFIACGVKKAPDTYYKHPMQFGDEPSPTPTPFGGSDLPTPTPNEPAHGE